MSFNVLEIKRVKPYLFIPLNERRDAHRPRCIYQTVPNYLGNCSNFAVRRAAILNFLDHQSSPVRQEGGPGAKSWSQAFYAKIYFIMSELSERTKRLPSEECSSSESVFVGYRQELVRNRKTKYNVNGRDIVIFYHNGNFHAMDQLCYRKF